MRCFKAKEEAKQEISMTNIIIIKEMIRIGIDQEVEIGEFSMDKITEVDQSKNDFRRRNFRGNVRAYQNKNFRKQNNRGGYRGNYRNEDYERCRSRCRERQYQGNVRRDDRSSSNRLKSGSSVSTNRDRTRCYKCREYDHFPKDCPTTKIEKEIDQIKQMLDGEEQMSLKC